MTKIRDYAVVTAGYWAFTLTDGALRMLVLLHLHSLGYSPLEVVSLFLFYELFGIVTNLLGGWLGARFGLKATLVSGLSLQIFACGLLAWRAAELTVPLVMGAQGLAGIAKDLTKMSSKSYIKLVVPEHDPRGLMRWVSLLTGSKNALKGVGFFLGGLLLATVGFRGACLGMAVGLALTAAVAATFLPRARGAVAGVSLRSIWTDDARVRWLAAARLFLFGARDVWFVLALPVFLAAELGWSFAEVGGFLALWLIGYGVVQAAAPAWVSGGEGEPPTAQRLGAWTLLLVLPLGALLGALRAAAPPDATLIVGLAVFGIVFAANSAVHSFLIVRYSDRERVSLNVGFYYMANAVGRLVGTILSGAVFQAAGEGMVGLQACLAVSIVLAVTSAGLCGGLRRAEARTPGS